MEAGFCGGFVAQYIMAATVDTLVPRPTVAVFFSFLLSPQAGSVPTNSTSIVNFNFAFIHADM